MLKYILYLYKEGTMFKDDKDDKIFEDVIEILAEIIVKALKEKEGHENGE